MSHKSGTLTGERRDVCPMLIPVTADRLCTYPLPAYCRRPDRRIRVPAATTLVRLCTRPAFLGCTGYRASVLKANAAAIVVERLWGGARNRVAALKTSR